MKITDGPTAEGERSKVCQVGVVHGSTEGEENREKESTLVLRETESTRARPKKR